MSDKTVKATIEVDAALEDALHRHLREFRAKHSNHIHVLWEIPAADPAEFLKAEAAPQN
jgi:hypothetical protein